MAGKYNAIAGATMTPNPTAATVIRIDDDLLPNGRCHSLCITMWTIEQGNEDDQQRAARFLAIDFLERTLLAMKLEAPVTGHTYWRAEYAEATVHSDKAKEAHGQSMASASTSI